MCELCVSLCVCVRKVRRMCRKGGPGIRLHINLLAGRWGADGAHLSHIGQRSVRVCLHACVWMGRGVAVM